MKKKRFKTPEEEMEALRNDPAFRALVEEMKNLTPKQIDRLNTWLDERVREEEADEE